MSFSERPFPLPMLNAADELFGVPGAQQRFHGVVDINVVAHDRAIAKHVDRDARERAFAEMSDGAEKPRGLLPRSKQISDPERHRPNRAK